MMFPSASLPSMASILAASPSFTASSAFQVQQRAPTKASGIRAGSFLGSRKGLVAAPCLALASRPQHGAAVTASAESDAFKLNRRDAISGAASAAAVALGSGFLPAMAYEDDDIRIITQEMEKQLEDIPMVTLPSGLQYKELKPGRGPTPPKGFQVTVNYVAMIAADPKSKKPGPRVIDSSIEKRKPYDIRLGTGSVIDGLDEGIRTMKLGAVRRLYIPGDLSFPNGLVSAPGRPRVAPASPVIFDVQLLLIPGFDADYDEDEAVPTSAVGFGQEGA